LCREGNYPDGYWKYHEKIYDCEKKKTEELVAGVAGSTEAGDIDGSDLGQGEGPTSAARTGGRSKKANGKKRATPRKRARGKRGKPRTRPRASADECARPTRTGRGQAQVVRTLLARVEKKLGGDDMKASLGDYIRLMQLHKELDDEAPREIKVSWVETEKSDGGK